MGFLGKLLVSPILAPLQGVTWIAEKIVEQADNEMYDEGKVRGQLMELELRYDLGEISEEDYAAAEEMLLDLLKVIRDRQAPDDD